MLVVCVSIATPALAAGPFDNTVELVGPVEVGADGNCYQGRKSVSHFFWFNTGSTPMEPIQVSCVQTSETSLNEFRD